MSLLFLLRCYVLGVELLGQRIGMFNILISMSDLNFLSKHLLGAKHIFPFTIVFNLHGNLVHMYYDRLHNL